MALIDSKQARAIEKIYLKHSPTRREDVEFVGVYKELGGFVVRLAKGKLPAAVQLAPMEQEDWGE